MPLVMSQLVDAVTVEGDLKKAAAMMQTVHRVCVALLRIGSNPAPVKALMNLAGRNVGHCRLPLVTITEAQTRELIAMVKQVTTDLRALGISFDSTLSRITQR